MKQKLLNIWLPGAAGAAALFFMGWQYNIPAAPWIAFPLLVLAFRRAGRWYETLPVAVLLPVFRFLAINGGWDLSLPLMAAFAVLVSAPLAAALYLDRWISRFLPPMAAVFVFPCVYIVLDYLLTFAKLGMTFSLAYSQCTFLTLVQSAGLFGSWYVGFLVAWFAPAAAQAAARSGQPRRDFGPLAVCLAVLSLTLCYGALRRVTARAESETVRVASITVPHDRDYWAITDAGTPEAEAAANKPGMQEIEAQLFDLSAQAADYGAKIIFWSEGNCPLYEDDYDAFLQKASAFAEANGVYFMPAVVELLYGRTKNNNLALMFGPDGTLAFRYEKTVSWYPTDSDGIIPAVDTPYGRVAAAICFDMDDPRLIVQARDADIMLVPGSDTRKIDDYHTQAAFLRGIENGFSTVRQANDGSSISADYLGNTLTYQNYFRTDDRVMISDVPTQGVRTLYGATGEVFLWLVWAGAAALCVAIPLCLRGRRKRQSAR